MKNYCKEIVIGVLIIVLLFVGRYTNNRQNVLQGEKNVLKEQLKKSTKSLNTFREQQKVIFDSIFLAEKVKNKRMEQLNKNNKQLAESIDKSKKELQIKKDSYKNKSLEQLANVFKEQGYENVTFDNISVRLQEYSPVAVLDDLAEGVNCFEDLKSKDNIIKNKDEELEIIQSKVYNRDFLLISKQQEIEKVNISLKLLDELNIKSDKQIKSLKINNIVNKILVPVSLGVGLFVGYKITK